MHMSVYVCETADKADQAVGFLQGMGFPDSAITKEAVGNFNYDAATYNASDHGSHDHFLTAKWVVIGRR